MDQQFGFRLSVCDLREGYSESRMVATQINYYKFIQEIVKFIPAFTDQGFHKTRVPEALLSNLLRFRDESLMTGNGPTVIHNSSNQDQSG